MKTLKSIINAVLILLMAIYGLAMFALLILPFVDVTNLFPGAEVHYHFLDGVTGLYQSYNLPFLSCLDFVSFVKSLKTLLGRHFGQKIFLSS